ncbi:MAG TPA: hypothetical protein VF878_01775 [Candidatus Udaeobacter sp.]
MNRKLRPALAIVVATALLSVAVGTRLTATAEYDYKPGEYLVAKDGLSPNKQFAIVCGDDKFGVYLMDAKTKELLGELEGVAQGLDTAPEAYRVHWSPDSKHVGICSRWERHYADNVIYRIENPQAYVVESPELRCHAVQDFCRLEDKLAEEEKAEKNGVETDAIWKMHQNAGGSEIKKWLSPARFIVFEESEFKVKEHDPSASLGKYAKVEKEKSYDGSDVDIYRVSFKAEGECELLPSDKSRVISTHPVKNKK